MFERKRSLRFHAQQTEPYLYSEQSVIRPFLFLSVMVYHFLIRENCLQAEFPE